MSAQKGGIAGCDFQQRRDRGKIDDYDVGCGTHHLQLPEEGLVLDESESINGLRMAHRCYQCQVEE